MRCPLRSPPGGCLLRVHDPQLEEISTNLKNLYDWLQTNKLLVNMAKFYDKASFVGYDSFDALVTIFPPAPEGDRVADGP